MREQYRTSLGKFIRERNLPESYANTAQRWFLPLAEEIARAARAGDLKVLGIVGSQGSGKSTVAALLALLLNEEYQLKVAVLSLDDFYHTREYRRHLGETIHPLLSTRGVPGTHDINLALRTLDELLNNTGQVAIPRFDKARDDRRPPADWDNFAAPADLVIFEGWCLSARPQPDTELQTPINELEANEDADGRWRRYVNHHLEEDYPLLFQRIEFLVALLAPDFGCVYRWRRHQEKQLPPDSGDAIMDDRALQRFVQHFERVTRYNLPFQAQANVVFHLDYDQSIVKREDNADG